MVEAIQKYLQAISIGELQISENMVILPLFLENEAILDYLTLDEALNNNTLTITEVNQSGDVPHLKVVNRSDQMVLILAGEEFIGAKQNRIANVTMLIGELKEIIIPVSCVERGRWSYKTGCFSSEERMSSACMRKDAHEDVAFSIRRGEGFHTNQSTVWAGISDKSKNLGVSSPSEAMSDIYSQKMDSIEECLRIFQPLPGQVGIISLIDSMVIGIDSFGKSDTLRKVYRKLLSSYAIEVLDYPGNPTGPANPRKLAQEFLDRAKYGKADSNPSVDFVMDVRIEGSQVIGSSLVFEDQVLHLPLFPKNNGRNVGSTIQSPSRRRNMLA